MRQWVLLPLLLLGTVSALHLEADAPGLGSPETRADLSQDADGSGAQEAELALTKEVVQPEGEEVEADPSTLDEDFQCPREEDTVQLVGSSGCKTCRYLLVQTPRMFWRAQRMCRRCYQGNLVSIHSPSVNSLMQGLTSGLNQGQVWIGGTIKGWHRCRKLRWTDGSTWNFGYWAPGQPGRQGGHCVALCTRGGHWRRAPCSSRLPFICSY